MKSKTSISNIAWPKERDADALSFVADLGFNGVELAPMKVFGPLTELSTTTVQRYRDELASRGLNVSAFQAILFGVKDVHLFKDAASRLKLADHLKRVAEVAGELEAKACVFGSPAVRDPGNLPSDDAIAIAVDFFGAVAPSFASAGTQLAFEANPSIYDCRFVTQTLEALDLVKSVNTPGFSLQIDTGTILANSEDPAELSNAFASAAYFHISEPGLVPLGTTSGDHESIGSEAAKAGYSGWFSIEMKEQADWQAAIVSSLPTFNSYRALRKS